MFADNKQINFNDADVSSPANSVRVTDLHAVSHKELEEYQPEQRRQLLLILLIVLFASLVIVFLANSSFKNHSVDIDIVYPQSEPKREIQKVKAEFVKVIDDLNEINRNPDLKDDHIEVQEVAVKPAVVIPLPAVVVNPAPVAPVVAKQEKVAAIPENKVSEKKAADEIAVQNKIVPVAAVIPPVNTPPAAVKQSAYIKHDTKGSSLEDGAEQWACVHDMNTGLTWEVKSEDDAMRKSGNLYSWYNPVHKTLQGKANGGRCKGDADCDTYAYVQAMNERRYCGHNDWQLPTKEEMQTLVNLENRNTATINKQYFPQTMPSWYWTSSENDKREDLAWYVLFRNGFALNDLKERPKHIRLVRRSTGNS